MRLKSFAEMRCPIAGALELVGDRWTLLLVRDLLLGHGRYDALRLSAGIPDATLTVRLKQMVHHGVVERVRYQDRPPRDEYRLTPKGLDLWKVSLALREWGDRWALTGLHAPLVETIDGETGRPLRLGLVDRETGMTVPDDRLRLRATPEADDPVRSLLDRSSMVSRC